jgi:hypothetical protein
VCDWSKPGVNLTAVVTWPSLGPSPDKLVFDVTLRRGRRRANASFAAILSRGRPRRNRCAGLTAAA